MARKKQEIQLQSVIETQEEWEEMLSKEGLTVVDVYQEWAGPCKAMLSNFRRLKNELGDDLLRFAVAKADSIESLEKYRGKCQPCFLCYGGGVLVAVVRGCNSPLLLKTVTEQLAYEHKVLDGQAERKEIRDTVVDTMVDKEKEDEEEEEEEVQKEVTVALIRPDIVAEGKVDEVIEKMKASGLEILEHQERSLTDEEAREFYSHSKDEEYFEDLIKLMTSGPSHVLVITKDGTGQGVIEKWRELIGPPSVEKAKEDAPDSFRAQFGKEGFANAVHGSDSHETAMRELAFFFPSFAVPSVAGKPKKTKIQRTLALIRPDAVKDEATRDALLAKIREAGFEIAMQKEVTITKEQAEEFYKEHKAEAYFDELTTRMSSGPLLALCLAREDAVTGWREMLGPAKLEEAKAEKPESLRAQFSVEGVEINQIHGADTEDSAEKEINYFFPMQQTLAVIKPDAYESRDEIMEKIKEAGFHIAARQETELTKDVVAQLYKDQQDKEYFGDLTEHMTSGPTLFMVLSGVNAVEGWRSKMGATNPADASEDSLRAMYGKDVKANALHGASTEESAKEAIQAVFGDLQFDKNEEGEGQEEETKPQEEGEAQQEQGEGEGKEETAEESKEGGEATEQQGEQEQEEQGEEQGGQGEEQATQSGEAEQEQRPQSEETPAEGAEQTQGEETQQGEAQEGGEGEQTEQPAESEEPKGDEGQTQEQQEGGEQTQEGGGGEEGEQKEETTQEESKEEENKEGGEESKEEESKEEESKEEAKQESQEEGEAAAAQEGEQAEGGDAPPAETEGQAEEGQTGESEGQKEEGEGQAQEAEGEKPAEEAPPAEGAEQTEQTEQTEQGEAKEEDKPAAE